MKHFFLLLFTAFFSLHTLYAQQSPFITTWEVMNSYVTIEIRADNQFAYNYNVDFGDGTIYNNITGNATHNYSTGGIYVISITGDFPKFDVVSYGGFDRAQLLSIDQWGDIEWQSMERAFSGTESLSINAIDIPDLSQVTNMAYMFMSSSINEDISNWDVSNVEIMEGLFRNAAYFNQPLNNWDVSNVQNMAGMFRDATSFNQPLDNWDVSKVSVFNSVVGGSTYIGGMFQNAVSFNQAIDGWDLSGATNMDYMFRNANSFNQPIDNWNVSGATSMLAMFKSASSFNQSLNSWDMSNVVSIQSMFEGASSFNGAIDNWDVSKVESMFYTFQHATAFNQNINSWDVSNVEGMWGMFRGASSFNQPLNNWNVSKVKYMERMFHEATSFNQPINNWKTTSLTHMDYMFYDAISFNQPVYNLDTSNLTQFVGIFRGASSFNQDLSRWEYDVTYNNPGGNKNLSSFVSDSGLDVNNYDALLNGFVQTGIYAGGLGAVNLIYCDDTARDILINTWGWTINGDIFSPDCNNINGSIIYDSNNDGCDTHDIYLNNFMVSATDGTTMSSTFSDNGIYNMNILGPSFTVSIPNAPTYFTVSPASANITFSGSNTEVLDFCVTANQTINDLNVTFLPLSQARPGFQSVYKLVVQNVGTQTMTNIDATLQFDDLMQQFVSSTPAPGNTATNTLSFPIGTLQSFQKFEAEITMLTFQPPTVNGADILNFTAQVTPINNDNTPNDNIYNLAQTVVNSYDPNDKQVLQGEELHINDADDYLDYIIRFQNTGTASAINVRILDTLHPKLDWNTLLPISASHDYYVKIADGNKVEFMFNNIHLPDSTSNEPASHGYVAYKIKPKNNVQVGDIISGNAGIYFDFNPPIITNTVYTHIVEPLGVEDISGPEGKFVIYPNPTGDILNIYYANDIQLEEIVIYDLQGRKIQQFLGNNAVIDVSLLNAGIYFLQITSSQGTFTKRMNKK